MNTLGLFTKIKIEGHKINDSIIKDFPFKKRIVQNDDIELFVGKYPREFYIVFSEEQENTEEAQRIFTEDDKSQIPFENWSFNVLYYWDVRVAQYVVQKIQYFYPELFLLDESTDIFLKPEDFLK